MVRRMSGRGGGHIFWHSTQTELMNEARYLTSQTHVAFRHSHPLSLQNIKLINPNINILNNNNNEKTSFNADAFRTNGHVRTEVRTC